MSNVIYSIGCDAGKQGHFSLIAKSNGSTYYVDDFKMPISKEKEIDAEAIVNNLENWLKLYYSFNITIESQMVITGQGLSSALTTGIGLGLLKGICYGMKVPVKLVTSKTWQKVYPTIDIPEDIALLNIKDTKKKSLATCLKLFPNVNIKTKRGKYLDGFSDSLLIANFSLNY